MNWQILFAGTTKISIFTAMFWIITNVYLMHLQIAVHRPLVAMLNSATNAGKSVSRITVAVIGTVLNVKAHIATDGLHPACQKFLIASIFIMFSLFPTA